LRNFDSCPLTLESVHSAEILRDRIVVDGRVYGDVFDDEKTEAGKREVPFDKRDVLFAAIRRMWAGDTRFHKPDDLILANKPGRPLDRQSLLSRHLKPITQTLGPPKTVDFRSHWTMHASLMRRFDARLKVARDNTGLAGGTGSFMLDGDSKTWWNERVEAVSRIVEAVVAK
jgi:hypothetical protein